MCESNAQAVKGKLTFSHPLWLTRRLLGQTPALQIHHLHLRLRRFELLPDHLHHRLLPRPACPPPAPGQLCAAAPATSSLARLISHEQIPVRQSLAISFGAPLRELQPHHLLNELNGCRFYALFSSSPFVYLLMVKKSIHESEAPRSLRSCLPAPLPMGTPPCQV